MHIDYSKLWPLYDKPVYWSLPDDGAPIRCSDCKENFDNSEVLLTQIPSGERNVICKGCIDENWLKLAENKGLFTV